MFMTYAGALAFQLNTIQRITETCADRRHRRLRVFVSIKHYPTNN